MSSQKTEGHSRGTRWCSVGAILAGAGLTLAAAGLFLARLGLLASLQAFALYGVGSLLLMLAAVVAGIGLAVSKGFAGAASPWKTWFAFGLAAAVTALNASRFTGAVGAPPINDITTDFSNPPMFVQIIPLRAGVPNSAEYPGAEAADLQRDAYPDIQTQRLPQRTDIAFSAAQRVVEDMGWTLVDADAAAGRIEAVDMTFWFRFADDVVIRLRPSGSGTDVDIRSKSRVGVGDMGTNARRVRAFQERLNTALAG